VVLSSNFVAGSNMLDRRLDEVGVGAANRHVNGSRTTAWTVALGTPRHYNAPKGDHIVKKF